MLSLQDKPEYVNKRIKKLLDEGIVTALVALSKTDSEQSRELLARYEYYSAVF